ncbi:MAG: type II toxin-antitoxin system VapB family antitoxin [Azoarcus sp.]|nr:type II toxin-antitoxin system VapB family antitoxin [Azoarcus sp.]
MRSLAKIFMSGRSQAVRLPKELRFSGNVVIARRFANGVLLLPVEAPWQAMLQALDEFEPDFVMEREQPVGQQSREEWPQ